MIEQTVTLVKKEHVKQAYNILNELDEIGKRIKTIYVEKVPESIARLHYAPHEGKIYFSWIVNSMKDEPVVFAVYEGEGIVQKIRDKIGPIDPSKAPKDTIRGKYSTDSLELAIREHRSPANAVHASDSVEQAKREKSVWYAYLGLEA